MDKVSIILTTRNTFRYIKLAVESLRKDESNNEHEIIIMDDNSSDGTKAWLKYYDKKLNFVYKTHNKSQRKGLMILNEEGIQLAKNDIIFLGHSDMVFFKDCITNLLKYIQPKKVLCSTRIEPPLYSDESIRYQRDWGTTPEEFLSKVDFEKVEKLKVNRLTDGVFAPILMYKQDFCGYDKEFLPQSREDSRLFYQMAENGCKFYQSWSSLVYHFSGKGSRRKDSNDKDSEEWQKSNYKNTRNFIRLYGELPNHLNQQPPVRKKKKISLCVATYNDEKRILRFLENMEPYFDEIIIADESEDNTLNIIDNYIEQENQISSYCTKEKFKIYKKKLNGDYSALRNFMQDKATNEWVLHADPDEIFSKQLLLPLREIIQLNGDKIDVFGIPRLNYLNEVLVNDIPRNKWNKEDLELMKNEQRNK